MPIKIIRIKAHSPGKPRKLTIQQERDVTRRYKLAGEKRKALCEEYGISQGTFHSIIRRTSLVTLHLGPGAADTSKAA